MKVGCEAASTNRSVPAKQASKMPISNIKHLRRFVEVVVSCILKTDWIGSASIFAENLTCKNNKPVFVKTARRIVCFSWKSRLVD